MAVQLCNTWYVDVRSLKPHGFVHFVHERVVQVVHWCNRRPSPLSPSRPTQKKSFWWANYFLQNTDARRRAEKCMVCTTNCLPPNCIIQKWQHSKFEEKMEGQKLDQSDWAQKMLSLSLSLSLFRVQHVLKSKPLSGTSHPRSQYYMNHHEPICSNLSWTKISPPVQCPALPPWYPSGFGMDLGPFYAAGHKKVNS